MKTLVITALILHNFCESLSLKNSIHHCGGCALPTELPSILGAVCIVRL